MSFTVGVVWRIRDKSTQALRIVRSISAAHPSQVGHICDRHGSQNDRRDRYHDVKSSHLPSFEPSPRCTLKKTAHSTVLSQSITNHAFLWGSVLSIVKKTRSYVASANGNGQSACFATCRTLSWGGPNSDMKDSGKSGETSEKKEKAGSMAD